MILNNLKNLILMMMYLLLWILIDNPKIKEILNHILPLRKCQPGEIYLKWIAISSKIDKIKSIKKKCKDKPQF